MQAPASSVARLLGADWGIEVKNRSFPGLADKVEQACELRSSTCVEAKPKDSSPTQEGEPQENDDQDLGGGFAQSPSCKIDSTMLSVASLERVRV